MKYSVMAPVMLMTMLMAMPAMAQDSAPELPPLEEQELAPLEPVIVPDGAANPVSPTEDSYVPQIRMLEGAEKREWLDKMSAWFNSFQTLQARFTQLGFDGTFADGELKIKRPGKFRFDYDPPVPLMMVSDGFWFVMVDKELETNNRLPMLNTPFAPITAKTVDLANNPDIVIGAMQMRENAISVSLSKPGREDEGHITLFFRTSGDFALTQWEVIDATGLPTTVVLGDIRKDIAISNLDFVVFDKAPGED